MSSPTDTNQASEDELRMKIYSTLKSNYGDGEPGEEAILRLIRTEKLKLLDEVVHQSTVNLKSAKAVAGWAELRKEQLEAEL